MELEKAFPIIKKIMRTHQGYALCGSAALLLAERISERTISDLDFVCLKEVFNPEGLTLYGDYGPSQQDGYLCYKVTTDSKTGFYFNVFVHDNSSEIDFEMVKGIRTQKIEDILAWKRKFNRSKDRLDLGLETQSNYLPF